MFGDQLFKLVITGNSIKLLKYRIGSVTSQFIFSMDGNVNFRIKHIELDIPTIDNLEVKYYTCKDIENDLELRKTVILSCLKTLIDVIFAKERKLFDNRLKLESTYIQIEVEEIPIQNFKVASR
jgi:hypothetical protein